MRRTKSKRNLEDQEAEDEPDVPILSPLPSFEAQNEVIGVVKARASTTTDVSLMWEGRLRNSLVSLGVVSNLTDLSKPIKSIGLELSYFSSG